MIIWQVTFRDDKDRVKHLNCNTPEEADRLIKYLSLERANSELTVISAQ